MTKSRPQNYNIYLLYKRASNLSRKILKKREVVGFGTNPLVSPEKTRVGGTINGGLGKH
jgi:hypothetical protein